MSGPPMPHDETRIELADFRNDGGERRASGESSRERPTPEGCFNFRAARACESGEPALLAEVDKNFVLLCHDRLPF